MKKYLKRIIALLTVYIVLLVLLFFIEKNNADSNIKTFGDAIWYSIITFTTVGYGDLYPVSPFGRIIGIVFVICSMGFIATVIGTFISAVDGNLRPRLILWKNRKKHWYILDGLNGENQSLVKELQQKKNCFVMNCCESENENVFSTSMSAEQLLEKHKDDADVFLLEDALDLNFKRAVAMAEKAGVGAVIYCRTQMDEDSLPANVKRFCPEEAIAREYWRTYPIGEERTVVLAGSGRLMFSILERVVLTNITDHPVAYYVYGEDGNFLRCHYCLDEVLSINEESAEKDSLIFVKEPFGSNPELLRKADRIILCDDTDNLKNYRLLGEYYPTHAKIHIYDDIKGVTCFGRNIYTAENIMETHLTDLARNMNEIYRNSVNYPAPTWEELAPFYRRSNIAAADHLIVKTLLLGHAYDAYKAYLEYIAKTDEEKFALWRLEHERWLRFYALSNWKYGAEKSVDERTHPMMVKFEALDYEEQKKDEDAWLLLEKVGDLNGKM